MERSIPSSVKFPRANSDFVSFRDAFVKYILPGFIPEKPLLPRSATVLTQGSCFAESLHQSLANARVNTSYIPLTEIANSPLANRIYFDYALAGKPYASASHKEIINPAALAEVRRMVERSDVFVFTVGIAFCPFVNGEFAFDFRYEHDVKNRVWRMTSVDENRNHLEAIVAMVKAVQPKIQIVLTVSPIPLNRSFTMMSPFVADCLSKSTLRTAVGQVMDLNIPNVHYWPSFEAIRWLSGHMGPFFGTEGKDHRHLGASYVQTIVDTFVEGFFEP